MNEKVLSHEADMTLRRYVVQLADTCIANKYEGIECELATYLAARVYNCAPADLRPLVVEAATNSVGEGEG